MNRDDRARRSVLFTPGTHPDRIRKAWTGPAADVVVADLEDGVAPDGKDEARRAVADLLQAMQEDGKVTDRVRAERAVRINAWPGPLAERDLEAVLAGRPELIVVPKCASPDAIAALDARLADLEARHGLDPGSTGLLLILETAAGVLDARILAEASPRVVALAFGAEDLAADAGMRRSPENTEVATARALVALAAAATGVQAIDMITADYQDLDRTRREAQQARSLGYAGKMVIHPGQVEPVHEGFAPTPDEVAWADKVLAAVESEGVGEGGVVVVDSRMVDRPLVEQARRIRRDAGA